MDSFDRQYCSWLEALTEAQQRCESVTVRLLDVEQDGSDIATRLTGEYFDAHDRLRVVASRFPGTTGRTTATGL